MSKLATLGILTPAVWLLFCLSTTVNAGIFDGYEWPAEAEQILKAGHQVTFDQGYSEAQADEFLANALVYHVRQAFERARQPYGRYQRTRIEPLISAATLRPKHTTATKGIVQATRRRLYKARWFSSPLFIEDSRSPMGVAHLHVPLPDQRKVPSLDLIRFDLFKPRTTNGFWLPTAIVRPQYQPEKGRITFKKIYEYPTSVVLYRHKHRKSPLAAAESLEHTLLQKGHVWLRKLDYVDRDRIYKMWMKAPGSDNFLSSPFFNPEDSRLRKSAGDRAPESSTAMGHSSHQPVIDVDSSSEEDVPPVAHEFDTGSRHSSETLSDIPEASTSGANTFEQDAPDLVEHDFLNPQRNLPIQPIRPQALYPWQQRPIKFWSHPAPGFQQQHSSDPIPREGDVNLDLSLGPPSPSSGASSKSYSDRQMSGFSHTKK
ncbi:uncharacterized protein UTRI_02785 [Ustilago trichophora]|uniref:Effector family protein Eff1 n=1 Tax=Ustilago trichophora TaxID=86804 RepID=A0A5C3ENU8_9BASI|nr:uncharacterized protein UTRI_02785 [Ustilago trichophora]